MIPDQNRIKDALLKALPWYACEEDGTEKMFPDEPYTVGNRWIDDGFVDWVIIGYRDLEFEGLDWRETKCKLTQEKTYE